MRLTRTILLTGLIAGTLDILAACLTAWILKGVLPQRVLLYIASALFGKAAYEGGYAMMALGLLFHYLIAFSCVIVFFYCYRHYRFFRQSILLNAVLIGIVAWMVTNLLIIPLSKLPAPHFSFTPVLRAILILVVCIGLPTAFMARRAE